MNGAWVVGIIFVAVILISWLVRKPGAFPLKWLWTGSMHMVVGGIGLYFFNLLGELIQFSIPINLITAAVVGFLGIPGLAGLAALKWLLV
jgi:inhibitor of the pro-sigma K processing machinery